MTRFVEKVDDIEIYFERNVIKFLFFFDLIVYRSNDNCYYLIVVILRGVNIHFIFQNFISFIFRLTMRSSFTFNQKDQKIHSITNEIFPKFFFHAFLFVIPIKYPISLMLPAPSPPPPSLF